MNIHFFILNTFIFINLYIFYNAYTIFTIYILRSYIFTYIRTNYIIFIYIRTYILIYYTILYCIHTYIRTSYIIFLLYSYMHTYKVYNFYATFYAFFTIQTSCIINIILINIFAISLDIIMQNALSIFQSVVVNYDVHLVLVHLSSRFTLFYLHNPFTYSNVKISIPFLWFHSSSS